VLDAAGVNIEKAEWVLEAHLEGTLDSPLHSFSSNSFGPPTSLNVGVQDVFDVALRIHLGMRV
jgi:hypothetical protein